MRWVAYGENWRALLTCRQFGGQEPKPEAEVKRFATEKFNATFPMFSKVRIASRPSIIHWSLKIDVNGDNTHPVYKFLKTCFPGDITWNFAAAVRCNAFVCAHSFDRRVLDFCSSW